MTPTAQPGAAMQWSSASSTLPHVTEAARAVAATLAHDLGPGKVDLVVVFVGGSHARQTRVVADAVRDAIEPGCIIGGTAARVISRDEEIEADAGITAIAARMPGVEIRPFLLTPDPWTQGIESAEDFARAAPGAAGSEVLFVIGDPASLPMDRVLETFAAHAPDLRIVGGMASAGIRPGNNTLFLNDWIDHSGGIALALSGNVRVDVVVSQGCRPVGPSLRVSEADGHVLMALDDQPALERVEQVLRTLPEAEQERLAQGLYVGRPLRPDAAVAGDYLIRNLLGADRDRGALAVGDHLRNGEQVRLHLRDGESAVEDLELLLAPQEFDAKAQAAFLFACNGRGRGLFGKPHVDITTLQAALGGNVPAAGMFCAGEVGPVGDRNYMHGHTASIAIIRSKPPA